MDKKIPLKWLIVSHGFNMDGRAASLTVSDKLPYLLNLGIDPIVLSAITGEKDLRFLHYQLLPWGPSGLRFDFRHWVAKKYGRGLIYKVLTPIVSLLLLPFTALEKLVIGLSSQSSWSYAAASKGKQLIHLQDIDLIYSSGGAWSAHYAAWLMKKSTGKTWIAEIHDPMVIRDHPTDDGTVPRKTRDKRFQQKLESFICRDADHVWWFTNGALQYAKHRHPELGNKGFVVLPGANPPGSHEQVAPYKKTTKLHIAHFGSLANDRSISTVIAVLPEFFQKYPKAQHQLQIDIYGAGLDEKTQSALHSSPYAHNVVAHGRIENDSISGKSGRERIMEIMRSSDILLMLHGDYEWCAEYIPSKMYDYFWAYRPIWGITNRNPELDQILSERNHYLSHTLDHQSISATLETIWLDWNLEQLHIPSGDPISPKDAVMSILDRVV
jgi:glycosyltransferase involved in cell wall biosynthesis